MEHAMTRGSITKALISFSIPLILSGLLQQLYSWADAFIVGNMEGEAALAAIGATGSITGLFVMAITGFTSGITILSARFFGNGEESAQKKILVSFTLVLGAVFTLLSVLGILFSDWILRMLQTPADIFMLSKEYLQLVLLGVPFLSMYNVYAAVLRGIGNSRSPFYAVILSSVVNVVLDVLLVGILRWSTAGAALATVISQVLMTIYLVCHAARRYPMLRFRCKSLRLDTHILKKGCTLSLPITIQSLISSFGNLVLQNFMNSFGTATVAAITTAYRIDTIIMLPVINLGTGIATIVSQNIGAGEYQRVKKCLRIGIGLTAVVSLCLTAIVLLLSGDLIRLFGITEEATRIGVAFFGALAWFYVVFGCSMAIRGYLEGRGNVVYSGICGILMLAVRILLSYLLRPVFDHQVIAWAEAFAWCFQLLLYVAGAWYYQKKPFSKIQNS